MFKKIVNTILDSPATIPICILITVIAAFNLGMDIKDIGAQPKVAQLKVAGRYEIMLFYLEHRNRTESSSSVPRGFIIFDTATGEYDAMLMTIVNDELKIQKRLE